MKLHGILFATAMLLAAGCAGESLFDGKTLGHWVPTDFGGQGQVVVEDGRLVLEMGSFLTGVTWSGEYPRMDYEISLEAMRVQGNDFFCGLTFPVGEDPCSLILGGWGGGVTGLSSIDGYDASENPTTRYIAYEKGRWYRVRLRVTKERIEAWLDDEKIVDQETKDHRISIRPEVESSRPLGIASYCTTAALRNIRIRRVEIKCAPPRPQGAP